MKIHIIKTSLIVMYPQNQTNKQTKNVKKWGYPKYLTCDRVFAFLFFQRKSLHVYKHNNYF